MIEGAELLFRLPAAAKANREMGEAFETLDVSVAEGLRDSDATFASIVFRINRIPEGINDEE